MSPGADLLSAGAFRTHVGRPAAPAGGAPPRWPSSQLVRCFEHAYDELLPHAPAAAARSRRGWLRSRAVDDHNRLASGPSVATSGRACF